jgi:Domain of Unknown Function (DUF1080)
MKKKVVFWFVSSEIDAEFVLCRRFFLSCELPFLQYVCPHLLCCIMKNNRNTLLFGQVVQALVFVVPCLFGDVCAEPTVRIWTDAAKAEREDADFLIQGEYRSEGAESGHGAQVIALGGGKFDAVIYTGGLPGAGWEPSMKSFNLQGAMANGSLALVSASGKTQATVGKNELTLTKKSGVVVTMKRIERKSPTLGEKAPSGATVLFDGSSIDQWDNARMEEGEMAATGATSKKLFGSYRLHVEFRTPYKPDARGQRRGNSGIYHSGRWETQILDSFGLEVQTNECGGIYSIAKPRLNLCLPPLAWQTYDVEFTAATFDASAKRTAWPRMTVRLNGVLIHEDLELSKDFTASAPLSAPLTTPTGPIHLQNHDNPVRFRNIWIVEK